MPLLFRQQVQPTLCSMFKCSQGDLRIEDWAMHIRGGVPTCASLSTNSHVPPFSRAFDEAPAGLHLHVQSPLHAAHFHVLVEVAVHVALGRGQFQLSKSRWRWWLRAGREAACLLPFAYQCIWGLLAKKPICLWDYEAGREGMYSPCSFTRLRLTCPAQLQYVGLCTIVFIQVVPTTPSWRVRVLGGNPGSVMRIRMQPGTPFPQLLGGRAEQYWQRSRSLNFSLHC